ncbi:MAG: hypothetical protein AABY62_00440 [Pseudomonadota bacterium]
MHFTYCGDKATDLLQGDILVQTPEILATLKEVHPHYANNAGNRYFIVLTQSCDLVRGRAGDDPCPSRYIAIAPVRPLSLVIQRETVRLAEPDLSIPTPVCSSQARNRLHNFLERLFNNNEPNFFYLHEDPSMGFPESCCAFLRLSIALRAKERYNTCLNARLLQLDESFRAKLGWLVGNLYSRVGTKDWAANELNGMIRSHLTGAALWLEDERTRKQLLVEVSRWKQDNPGQVIDEPVLRALLNKLKPRKEAVLERLKTLLAESDLFRNALKNGIVTEPALNHLVDRKLRDDPQLATLLR